MRSRNPLRQLRLTIAAIGLGVACSVQVLAADARGKVAFRKPKVEVDPAAGAEAMPAVPTVTRPQKSLGELEDLNEKKQTLEAEVRYAKAKLEAAQKNFASLTTAGNLEAADRLSQETKDWEARYLASKQQLAQVQNELEGVNRGAQSAYAAGNAEVVVPGETLEIFVNEDPSFNGRYQVRRGGYIILPQVGRIAVSGKTIEAAEQAVKRALQSSQLKQATVTVERISGSDIEAGPLIYLSGEFKDPRPWHIPKGTAPTLVNVILSSGGISDKADLTRVRVMRMTANKGVVEEVNVQRILDGAGLTSDLTLGEGDVITIPAGNANMVYVTGNVKQQGSFRVNAGEKFMAYGAILRSGGFARFADLRKVHILRAMPDGTKAKLPVNIEAIQKGQRPDVQLQSGDIIVIPEKFWSF